MNRFALVARFIAIAATLVFTFALPACKSVSAVAGSKRDITAKYAYRTLKAVVPETLRVPTVAIAADQALRNRGYMVASREITEDQARVEGLPPRDTSATHPLRSIDKAIVNIDLVSGRTGPGTRIQITLDPLGDQAKSRAILDEMLQILGR
jgi:hypothetical protein